VPAADVVEIVRSTDPRLAFERAARFSIRRYGKLPDGHGMMIALA
jgi:hypothetical protein